MPSRSVHTASISSSALPTQTPVSRLLSFSSQPFFSSMHSHAFRRSFRGSCNIFPNPSRSNRRAFSRRSLCCGHIRHGTPKHSASWMLFMPPAGSQSAAPAAPPLSSETLHSGGRQSILTEKAAGGIWHKTDAPAASGFKSPC